MKFSDYKLKDFIQDKSFQNWVNKADADDTRQWNTWVANNPAKKRLTGEASDIIRGIRFVRQLVPRPQIEDNWRKLAQSLAHGRAAKVVPAGTNRFNPLRLAVVWLGLLLSAVVGGYIYNRIAQLHYQTGYGETATIVLPDQSTVVLNSNSQLRLARYWRPDCDREVWLEGEAFFQVVKQPGLGNARFRVHTTDMEVKVLGTRFNVNSRRTRTRVVLNSGAVQVQVPQAAKIKSALMQPGELAELDASKKILTKKKVNPLLYSSWIHKKLLFDDTSIAEIASMLQDNYGLEVKLADPALADRRLTGEIYVEDVGTLLKALSKSFQLELTQTGNTLLIKGR